jgi:hypothetical protein
MNMTHDALLRARANALNDFLGDSTDEEYDAAEKAVDLFMDYLEKDIEEAEEVRITETGSVEIISSSNTAPADIIIVDEIPNDEEES